MGRRIRPGYLTQNVGVSLGTASAVVALTIAPPFLGAKVQGVNFIVKTAGVGTGTYDVKLQGETGNTVLASATGLDADLAVDKEMADFIGNGVGADETDLELDVVVNGTVSGAAVVDVNVLWM